MKYKIGDIIVLMNKNSTDESILNNRTAIITEVVETNNLMTGYYGFIKNEEEAIQFMESQIISYGAANDVINEREMETILHPKISINLFDIALMLHLIRTEDKYDLQILYKCNYWEKNKYHHTNTKIVLDALFLKTNLTRI